jgi:hypothetical protein
MRTSTLSPTRDADIRRQLLSFLRADAERATGPLAERTYERLQRIVEQYFDGVSNHHSYDRVDWRIVHRLFSYIWQQDAAKNTQAWGQTGEDLYGEMRYLHDHPPIPRKSPSTPLPTYRTTPAPCA